MTEITILRFLMEVWDKYGELGFFATVVGLILWYFSHRVIKDYRTAREDADKVTTENNLTTQNIIRDLRDALSQQVALSKIQAEQIQRLSEENQRAIDMHKRCEEQLIDAVNKLSRLKGIQDG